MTKRFAGLVLLVPATSLLVAGAPFQRKQADPGVEAKTARIVTRGQRQAGGSLKADDATRFAVQRDCGPVQIGGADADQRQRTSLLRNQASPRESNTVTRDTVVICRR